jgi:hypothetical protein
MDEAVRGRSSDTQSGATFNPFADLKARLQNKG